MLCPFSSPAGGWCSAHVRFYPTKVNARLTRRSVVIPACRSTATPSGACLGSTLRGSPTRAGCACAPITGPSMAGWTGSTSPACGPVRSPDRRRKPGPPRPICVRDGHKSSGLCRIWSQTRVGFVQLVRNCLRSAQSVGDLAGLGGYSFPTTPARACRGTVNVTVRYPVGALDAPYEPRRRKARHLVAPDHRLRVAARTAHNRKFCTRTAVDCRQLLVFRSSSTEPQDEYLGPRSA